MKNPAQS